MDTVGVRDLANRASAVLEQLEETGQPVLVTRHGRPVAVLFAIDEEAFHDYVLASAPEFVRDRSEAEDRWARGADRASPGPRQRGRWVGLLLREQPDATVLQGCTMGRRGVALPTHLHCRSSTVRNAASSSAISCSKRRPTQGPSRCGSTAVICSASTSVGVPSMSIPGRKDAGRAAVEVGATSQVGSESGGFGSQPLVLPPLRLVHQCIPDGGRRAAAVRRESRQRPFRSRRPAGM